LLELALFRPRGGGAHALLRIVRHTGEQVAPPISLPIDRGAEEMADDAPLEHHENQALADEAARGRRADRELAARLDRPSPGERTISADQLESLTERASARGEPDREVFEAAIAGDQHALEEVVNAYLPRIAALSRRYAVVPHVERLELTQEGVAGLLQALKRYDPARGTPFWAYARPTVERAMQRLVGELANAVELPDRALRHLSQLRSAEHDLMQENRRLPSRAEIIERSGLDHDLAAELIAGAAAPRSLQEPITTTDGDVIGLFGDLVDDPSAGDAYDQVLDEVESDELMPLLSVLSSRERKILELHYGLGGEELSHRQIAERLGLSVSRVRQIERRALRKLQRAAEAVGAGR
jgi:RNA polymerase primary sigma factor